jgi:hypothetical protein
VWLHQKWPEFFHTGLRTLSAEAEAAAAAAAASTLLNSMFQLSPPRTFPTPPPPFCIGVYLPKEADSTGLVSLDKYVFRFMRSSTNKKRHNYLDGKE